MGTSSRQARSWRSQAIFCSNCFEAFAFSLYCQCAATPYSAWRCIASVRICTSSVLPPGPSTAVCSDW
jgi:hypothetical protein